MTRYILINLLKRKQKQKRITLLIELFLSFLAFFFIFSLIVREINNTKYPLGFNYDKLYSFNPFYIGKSEDMDANHIAQKELISSIQLYPGVEAISNYNGSPFFSKGYLNPSQPVNGNGISIPAKQINLMHVQDGFGKALDLKFIEGRWFTPQDNASNIQPVVLTQNLKEMMFGNSSVIGNTIELQGEKCKIVGVCNVIKHKGDYSYPEPTLFVRIAHGDNVQYKMPRGGNGSIVTSAFLLKSQIETSAEFESELYQYLKTNHPDFQVLITPMNETRNKYIRSTILPLVITLLIITALFFNVLFGMFGVLWYNISQRKSEIGLRMAVGASKTAIYRQFITEMLLLTTIAIVPGIVIAIQFPILNILNMEPIVYVVAIISAAILIYSLVVLCALMPSSRATKIQPAIALHEE